jgi:hypothetical protein
MKHGLRWLLDGITAAPPGHSASGAIARGSAGGQGADPVAAPPGTDLAGSREHVGEERDDLGCQLAGGVEVRAEVGDADADQLR